MQNVDLNLLYLFSILYEERNVSRAAERLFLTPSAVSHALRRLRLMMNDDLFTRGVGGMAPTPRANEIARRLHTILPQIRDVMAPPEFRPVSTSRAFAIASVPYLTSVLLPDLAARFRQAAPTARLDIRLLYGSVADDIESGLLDVALGNFRRTPPHLVAEDLFEEQTVWVMRRDSRRGTKRLSLGLLAALPHIDILTGVAVRSAFDSYDVRHGLERLVMQNNLAAVDAAFAENGLHRDVRWTAPDTLTAMRIAAKSDGITLVPLSAAERFSEPLGLALHQPPYRSTPLTIQMLYHADYGRRPAVGWLLEVIRSGVAALTAAAGDHIG